MHYKATNNLMAGDYNYNSYNKDCILLYNKHWDGKHFKKTVIIKQCYIFVH